MIRSLLRKEKAVRKKQSGSAHRQKNQKLQGGPGIFQPLAAQY